MYESIIQNAIKAAQRGTSIAITGCQGSGKSTLFTELLNNLPSGIYPKLICIDEVVTENDRQYITQYIWDKQTVVIFTHHAANHVDLIKILGENTCAKLMHIVCKIDNQTHMHTAEIVGWRIEENVSEVAQPLSPLDIEVNSTYFKGKEDKMPKELKAFDMQDLRKKGEYILSLCVDIPTDEIFAPVAHHLPLLNNKGMAADEENWNLSAQEKATVKMYLKELADYAEAVIAAYHNETVLADIEILPLWIVFPHYTATTIGWRMGLGEDYEEVYYRMMKSKDQQARTAYKVKYPVPPYMVMRSKG